MPLFQELRRRWWVLALALVLLLVLLSGRLATFYTDVLWFDSVGYLSVFTTELLTQLGLGLAAGLIAAALAAANLALARRLAPPYRIPTAAEAVVERYRDALAPYSRILIVGVSLLLGLLAGSAVTPVWREFLLWANAVDFGREDPQFGLDLSYFVFRLPFWTTINSWLFGTVAAVAVLTGLGHYLFGGIRPQAPGQKVTPQVNVHLSVLLAVLIGIRAWGFWLDRHMLSYSERGVVTGLSYTDVNAQLVAFELLTVIAVVCVALFLANVYFRNFLLPAAGVGILLVAAIVLSGIYPAAIQRLQVEPQELARERPYIERNLALTRFGYGLELEGVDETAQGGGDVAFNDFPATEELSAEAVADNAETLESIRLWDPATLSAVYNQLQGLRRYFEFNDIDVDRYDIDGEQRQVNLSVRELEPEEIPEGTWQNSHLVYTHGFGVVATDTSSKTGQGEPEFLVRNIPPQGVPELEIDQPRIYFGERGPDYSIVRTDQPELDYIGGEDPDEAAFRYDGEAGVGIGPLVRRAAFALRLSEVNLLISDLLTDESRILFNRDIEDRLQLAAPFLQFDSDPYAVAIDGGVKWIVDAYTITDMLPYSERENLGNLTSRDEIAGVPVQQGDGSITIERRPVTVDGLAGEGNYIRNSVKAVVDAYDGSITLYRIDGEDPLIEAWSQIFPDALTDVSEAPAGLQEHFRYPEDLFRVQSDLFTRYHIPEANGFYSREDLWRIPTDAARVENEGGGGEDQNEGPQLRPYYLNLRLPGQDEEEFALIQPFNPSNRPNLIAWLAARSDPENYGELIAYRFPETQNVDGTEQIQAQINQDGELAAQITLLSQAGSDVIYGNLLVIPVGEALLYAQPLFVRAEQGQIPELRFVVLVLGDRVVFTPTLEESLTELFGDAAAPIDVPGQDTEDGAVTPGEGRDPDGGAELSPEVQGLIQDALDAFEEAEQALADGDLGAYQDAIRRAEEALRQAGGGVETAPAPSPSPAPSPAEETEPATEARGRSEQVARR